MTASRVLRLALTANARLIGRDDIRQNGRFAVERSKERTSVDDIIRCDHFGPEEH